MTNVIAVDICSGGHRWEEASPKWSGGPTTFPYRECVWKLTCRYRCRECGIFGMGETKEIRL